MFTPIYLLQVPNQLLDDEYRIQWSIVQYVQCSSTTAVASYSIVKYSTVQYRTVQYSSTIVPRYIAVQYLVQYRVTPEQNDVSWLSQRLY